MPTAARPMGTRNQDEGRRDLPVEATSESNDGLGASATQAYAHPEQRIEARKQSLNRCKGTRRLVLLTVLEKTRVSPHRPGVSGGALAGRRSTGKTPWFAPNERS